MFLKILPKTLLCCYPACWIISLFNEIFGMPERFQMTGWEYLWHPPIAALIGAGLACAYFGLFPDEKAIAFPEEKVEAE